MFKQEQNTQLGKRTGVTITCDRCTENFDEENRTPYILPDCGHTLCSLCVQELLTSKDSQRKCHTCNVKISYNLSQEQFKVNYKLLSLLVNPGVSGGGMNSLAKELQNAVACPRHSDRPVAYFCKSCNQTVCVDCIFDMHNGHILVNVNEMSRTVKQNVSDLSKMMMNTRRLTTDNLTILSQCREELNKLLQQQIHFIEDGFNEVLRRLHEKKHEFTVHFEKMYKKEDQKFVALLNSFEDFQQETSLIEKVFVELIEFVDGCTDSQLLINVEDVGEFINRSFDKLEKLARSNVEMRKDIYISDKLRPYIIDTKNSLKLVNQFEMVPPSKELFNPFELRFLKEAQTFAETQLKSAQKKQAQADAETKSASEMSNISKKEIEELEQELDKKTQKQPSQQKNIGLPPKNNLLMQAIAAGVKQQNIITPKKEPIKTRLRTIFKQDNSVERRPTRSASGQQL